MKILIAPIHLDAMLLTSSLTIREALADYSKLPYTNGAKDVNTNRPYLGESINSSVFGDKRLHLNPGVHLHWTLPQYLRHNKNGGGNFPAVPDRWLINRIRTDNRGNHVIEKSWLVESNYISTTQSADYGNIGAVNVPFHDDDMTNKTQPFRFMGRSQEVKSEMYQQHLIKTGASYLKEVTAIGYNPEAKTKGHGEQTFSTFYPNSASVFGFYDAEITVPDDNLTYEVLGLYGDSENDYLKSFLVDFNTKYQEVEERISHFSEALKKELFGELVDVVNGKEESFSIAEENNIPASSACYGKTKIVECFEPSTENVSVVMGNTPTEALSAYLAKELDGFETFNEVKIPNHTNELDTESEVGDQDSYPPEADPLPILDHITFTAQQIEEALEAIQLHAGLQNKSLDVNHKFFEKRHEKGFTASAGGSLWDVRTVELESGGENSTDSLVEIILSEELSSLLDEISTLQATYDRQILETYSIREEIFHDWCKYMISAYPAVDGDNFSFDQDELIKYIKEEEIVKLNASIAATGVLILNATEDREFTTATSSSESSSIAWKLALKITTFQSELSIYNEGVASAKAIELRHLPSTRYWEPNDPVVLFVEKKAANRNTLNSAKLPPVKRNALLNFRLLDWTPEGDDRTIGQALNLMNAVHENFSEKSHTGTHELENVWNPFMLEWEVEYLPAKHGSTVSEPNRNYDAHFIQQNYTLEETKPDFSLKGNNQISGDASIFRGSTVVTPVAKISLEETITDFNNNHKKKQPYSINDLLTNVTERLDGLSTLSQTLGGFNKALLMQKQSRQLDLADPIGFKPYQDFAASLVEAVGSANLRSAEPFSDFHPIRSGMMRVLKLRLIDSFGRILDFKKDDLQVSVSETLKQEGSSEFTELSPRFSQPARLNFRFLSAANGEQEMNNHAAATPVCGWLLANHLSRTIDCYDQNGSAIGSLTMKLAEPWRPAPDSESSGAIQTIQNEYLRQVVNYLYDKQIESIAQKTTTDNSFLDHFLGALESAEMNISPENFSEHLDLAMIIGQPLAIVRTKVQLELKGSPAKDQSWTRLIHELEGRGKSDAGFTKVKVPIRIGEHSQLNDGLYGYWLENENGELSDDYFSNEANSNDDNHIKTYATDHETLTVPLALNDAPQNMTMLVDPKGVIHATSGVLPVKAIHIPKEQYATALKQIGITFLSAPVLSPKNELRISLPKENGYDWSWIQQNNKREWESIKEEVIISRNLFDSKFTDQPDLWGELISEYGWLKPMESDLDKATITSKVRKAFPPNEVDSDPNPFSIALGKRLDAFFSVYGKRIAPFNHYLHVEDKQILKEGWLKMNPSSGI